MFARFQRAILSFVAIGLSNIAVVLYCMRNSKSLEIQLKDFHRFSFKCVVQAGRERSNDFQRFSYMSCIHVGRGKKSPLVLHKIWLEGGPGWL